MMVTRRLAASAVAVLVLGSLYACFSSHDTPASPDAADDGSFAPDTPEPTPDSPSGATDSTVAEAEAGAGDTGAPVEGGDALAPTDGGDAGSADATALFDASDAATEAAAPVDATDASALLDAADASAPIDAGDADGSGDAGPTGSGPFLYFADNTGSLLYGYTLAAATGVLTPIDMNPVMAGMQPSIATESRPMAVAAYPTGKYVYTAELSGNVGQYAIDPVTGVLTLVNRAVGDAGSRDYNVSGATFESIGIDALGRVLYLPDVNAGVLYALSIDATTGNVAVAGSVPVQSYPRGVGVDPAGHFLFLAGNTSPVVGRVALDLGGLPIGPDAGGTTFVTLAGSGNCLNAALSPAGTSYTVCAQDQRIYGVAYDAGAMALATVGFATAGVSPIGVAVHPNGNFAYAASFSNLTISTFSLVADAGGAPTLVGTPLNVSASCRTLAFDPSGLHLFAGCDGQILTFAVDGASGALTAQGTVTGPSDSSYALTIVDPPLH